MTWSLLLSKEFKPIRFQKPYRFFFLKDSHNNKLYLHAQRFFYFRHAYFLGANDPYKALKTTLKAEINEEAWESLHSDTSRPFPKPTTARIAVKVINHLGDEVMKVFKVP